MKGVLPAGYRPLEVANACFVEAVNYYDFYTDLRPAGERSWARLLHWSDREGLLTLKAGHAVTVFVAKSRLWAYDVNYGIVELDTPVDRRGDLLDVGPEVFKRYPLINPALPRYHEDFSRRIGVGLRSFSPEGAEGDLEHVLKVAERFADRRPVRVVRFSYPSPEGETRESAAAVFLFGSQLCIYSPQTGTTIVRQVIPSVNDMRMVKDRITHFLPGATDLRWYEPTVVADRG